MPCLAQESSTAPSIKYRVKIEKVPNLTKYALPFANQTTAAVPSVAPSAVKPTTAPPLQAPPTRPDNLQAFAGPTQSSADELGPLSAIDSRLEPVTVTDNSGPPRGTGPLADMILQSTPQLGDYRSVTISDQSFKSYIQLNHGAIHANNGEVLVFKGRWDKAEHLLDQCGIAYSDAPRAGLSEKLSHAAVAIVDCPGELKDDQLEALRTFVRSGGYLVSTDWALDNCISKIFPGYLVWKGAYSNPETVDAVPVEPKNPLLKGSPRVSPWRLDDKSEIIELGGKGSINVLVRSRALQEEDPGNIGILAATIRIGTGKVLHMIGHFDNNSGKASAQMLPDPAPGIKISLRQSLAINFIVEALRRHQANSL